VADSCRLLGERMAEMHLALSTNPTETDFVPEEFSLHYQRSLFAGFQTLVRSTFQAGSKKLSGVPELFRADADNILSRRDEVLNYMKRIYHKKMDTWKIRIHGNFDLEQVLFTGKDLMFVGFAGDPQRSYSERRLKRSPLRDVAGIIRSIYYTAYEGIWMNNENPTTDANKLMATADIWAHYTAGIFLKSYLDKVHHTELVPEDEEDKFILINTFLLEKTLQSFQHEITYRPEWSVVPIRLIRKILG
jgi:maltose alpha-D-glucosyltransferase/alpha-amylase